MDISNVPVVPFLATSFFVFLNILIYIAVGVMIVYGFILLVKFLGAGTKAFNIYIPKNSNSYSNVKDNGEQK